MLQATVLMQSYCRTKHIYTCLWGILIICKPRNVLSYMCAFPLGSPVYP